MSDEEEEVPYPDEYNDRSDHALLAEILWENRKQVRLQRKISGQLTEVLGYLKPAPPTTEAVSASIQLGGHVPGSITVDTENETATVQFEDDKGDATAAPAGASITPASSDPTVFTVAVDSGNPFQVDVTPVGLGSAQLSAPLTGALEADGVTPIPDPTPVTITVSAGAADQAAFVLSV